MMNSNRPPIVAALLHPLNLAMLVLVIVAGLCSAWWLSPVGLVLWGIMVMTIARDPALQIRFSRQLRQPLAQRFQNRFDRLDRARISIFNYLQGVSPALRRHLQPVQDALDELVDHAYQLCLNMTALDNELAVQKLTSHFDSDIEAMQKNLANAANDQERKEFEEALRSLQARKAQLKKVETLLARFEAQLTGTNNAVDGVVTAIASLRGRDPAQAGEKVSALLQALQAEQAELQQFDEELRNTSLV